MHLIIYFYLFIVSFYSLFDYRILKMHHLLSDKLLIKVIYIFDIIET